MSIASAIQNAQQRVANAYDAVETKGGTLPNTQNLSNLPDAILSIPAGSGGDSVTVMASNPARTYQEGDKVLLTPSSIIYSDSPASCSFTRQIQSSSTPTSSKLSGFLDYVNGTVTPTGSSRDVYVTKATWNSSLTGYTGYTNTSITNSTPFIQVNYDGDFPWAMKAYATYYGNPRFKTLGYINEENAFVDGVDYQDPSEFTGSEIVSIGPFAKVRTMLAAWYVYSKNTNGTVAATYSPNRNCFPSKYNGDWYIVNESGVHPFGDMSITSYSCSGFISYTDGPCMKFFDANGDFVWEYDYSVSPHKWLFRQVVKDDSGWSLVNHPEVSSIYKDALRGGWGGSSGQEESNEGWVMHSKDHGDTVESFLVNDTFGYDSTTGKGNKVAHFIFDKATLQVTRLPDVFLEVSDSYGYCGSLQVNWDLGLISVVVINRSSSDSFAIYTKKLNNLAGMYEFVAFPTNTYYYTLESLTGFVEQNLGTDVVGNTILKVSTVRVPDSPPYSDVGIVFGMDIAVYGGSI